MATSDLLNGITAAGSTAATGSTAGTQATSSSKDRASLSKDDFYKIMISELTNQDPFQPLDNQQFLQQLASLQTLDVTGRLNDGIEKLILDQRLSSASSLIGHEVHALNSGTSGAVHGKVQKVQVQGSDVELLLDGDQTVKLTEVVEIS